MISIVIFHPGPGQFLWVFLLPQSRGTFKADGVPQWCSERQVVRPRRGEEVRVKNPNFVFVQSYWVASSELFPGSDHGECRHVSSELLRTSVLLWSVLSTFWDVHEATRIDKW